MFWASLVIQMVKNLPLMQETQVRSLGREDTLEKGMAAHSSILAWRIPWTKEPGGLQSMWNEKSMQDEDRIQVNCRTQSCNSFFLVTSVNFSSTFITA